MISSAEVKKMAREFGADIAGVASMDRFEGAPPKMDPRFIFPDAKAMIVLGFRVLRGCMRGIEEGTYYASYIGMGYGGINQVYAPMTLWNLCKWIEDNGYEAVPVPNEHRLAASEGRSRPVSPEKPNPDVMVHLRIAAFCAGLGEIGYSKMFLTPQFGPRQRFAAILTDAPLEPDPLFEGKICDRCMACAKACTGQCISRTKTVKVRIAGRDVEWGEIDIPKCSIYFQGGSKEHNPFMVTKQDEREFLQGKPRTWQYDEYARALEGASGCIRACMIHLDEKRRLGNKFENPFRKRAPWKLSPVLSDGETEKVEGEN
jgi:hypothetical protein